MTLHILPGQIRVASIPWGERPFSLEDWRAGKCPPRGWDCADAVDDGWSSDDITVMMRECVTEDDPPFPFFEDTDYSEVEEMDGYIDLQARSDDIEPENFDAPPGTSTTPTAKPGWERDLIEVDGKIRLDAIHNWMLVIENHPDTVGVFAYDSFRHSIMLVRCPPWEEPVGWVSRPIEPQDRVHLVMWLEQRHFKAKPTTIDPVILAVAQRNSFDPLVDYLTSLRWDGVERVSGWMSKYLGADDNGYASAVGKRFLISAVARGLRPGSKVDTMPILEGPQGLKKSSAIEALFSKQFFTDHLSGIGSKDALMELQGVWAIEVAEMDQFNRAETGQIKKFLTQKVDRYRPPYGRDVINAPRRCVLVGSINPDGSGYLRDPTGARRFWPVACRRIDVEAIHIDRDQLWAEAVQAFNAGEPWWVQEDEAMSVIAEQASRTDTDPWSDVLDYALKGAVEVAQTEVFKILGLETRDMGRVHTDRAIRVMISLGWGKFRDQRNGGNQTIFRRAGVDPVDTNAW
ncbi:MAG: VapE domain-containing protein [Devosia sp.]